MKDRPVVFEVFMGKNRRWYWHALHGNGRKFAQCAQGNGFKSRAICEQSIERSRHAFAGLYKIRLGLHARAAR